MLILVITREMLEGAISRTATVFKDASAAGDHDRASRAAMASSSLASAVRFGWRSGGTEFFVRSFELADANLADFDPFWAREWVDDEARAALALQGLAGRFAALGEAQSRPCPTCGAPSVVVGYGGEHDTNVSSICLTCLGSVELGRSHGNRLRAKKRAPRPLEACVPPELSLSLASPKSRELLGALSRGWRGCAGPAYLVRSARHPLGEVYWPEELADDPLAARAELGPPFAPGAKQRLGSLSECERRPCAACGAAAYVVGFDRDVVAYDPTVEMEQHTVCPSCGHTRLVHVDRGYKSRIAYE